MGTLRELGSERVFTPGSRCLIGRHPACSLRTDNPRVSAEHASLRWTGAAWELRDLSSRNGTFVGGKKMSAGERVALTQGDTFTLGGPSIGFTLFDATPPVASARHTKTGVARTIAGGLLVLPDDERPRVTVYEDRTGRWIAEEENASRTVSDHEIVVVDGEGWLLDLPNNVTPTLESSVAFVLLESVTLRFGVSRDEEHVEVTVVYDGIAKHLPPRSYHYLLLTLARARLADVDASPAEQGWVSREELCRMLATDVSKLNVDIFRARKQLGAMGIYGAAELILRRPDTGQIRLGIDRIEVVKL